MLRGCAANSEDEGGRLGGGEALRVEGGDAKTAGGMASAGRPGGAGLPRAGTRPMAVGGAVPAAGGGAVPAAEAGSGAARPPAPRAATGMAISSAASNRPVIATLCKAHRMPAVAEVRAGTARRAEAWGRAGGRGCGLASAAWKAWRVMRPGLRAGVRLGLRPGVRRWRPDGHGPPR